MNLHLKQKRKKKTKNDMKHFKRNTQNNKV